MFRIQRFFRLSSRVVCVQKKVSSSTACIATIISPENKLPLPTASSRFISFTEFRHQASNDVPDEIPIAERIEKLLKNKKVVIFMKGIPSDPMCGFSNAVVQVLRMHGVEDYDAHNVLDDEALRQGIKEFSDWPTIPQIYFNGEFIGGCDILLQMHQNGELIDEMEKIGIKSALVK